MQRKRIHDAHTLVCANFDYLPLGRMDLFADTVVDTATTLRSTATIKAPATPTKSIYRVELLPDGNTRITQHGRVTFLGIIRGAKA